MKETNGKLEHKKRNEGLSSHTGSRGPIPRHTKEFTIAEITKVGIKLSELLAPNVQIGIISAE